MIVEYGGHAGGGKTSDAIDLIANAIARGVPVEQVKWYITDNLWNFFVANMGEEWTKANCVKLELIPLKDDD